jgi:H+-translocating NAD(P) transhydrogenase subunit alpha
MKSSWSRISQLLLLVALTAMAADPVHAEQASNAARHTDMALLWFVFVISIFLGVELIAKVPSQLHTPLMSGSNAISGITIVGALIAAGLELDNTLQTVLGVIAVAAAMINVVGGYLVTDRMLAMFKHKGGSRK